MVDGDERPQRDEPFEIVRTGFALPLYGNNAQTLHTIPPLLWESLRRLFRRRRFDVMHVHAPYNPSFATLAPLVMPKGTVGVGTYHSVFSGGLGLDALAPLMRWSFSKLHAHVVVSEACIGSLAPYFPYVRVARDPERDRRAPLHARRRSDARAPRRRQAA